MEGARGLRHYIKPKNATANPKKKKKPPTPREIINFDNSGKAIQQIKDVRPLLEASKRGRKPK